MMQENQGELCPCASGVIFEDCCGPYLAAEKKPETAEQLMRSRYTAYTRGDVGYIKKTLAPEAQKDFDVAETRKWAAQAQWKGLKVLSTEKGLAADTKGVVEFMVTYSQDGKTLEHHEVAKFRKSNKSDWLFVDGDAHTHAEGETHQHHHHKVQTLVREEPKVGRNDPCVCGSGKKYKKCCGA